MQSWAFAYPPNVAVFTDRRIVRRETGIHYVAHDEDDGAWQFRGSDGLASDADAMVVSLRSIVDLEPTISELADLPLGWCAWREQPTASWQRAPKPPPATG